MTVRIKKLRNYLDREAITMVPYGAREKRIDSLITISRNITDRLTSCDISHVERSKLTYNLYIIESKLNQLR